MGESSRKGKAENKTVETEVVAKAQRQQYTAEYKERILAEVDKCKSGSEVGALLRREGLYSSLVSKWRQRRQAGVREGLARQKRGPKVDEQTGELVRLQRETDRLRERLRQAELIIEVQKKVSQMLGMTLNSLDEPQ